MKIYASLLLFFVVFGVPFASFCQPSVYGVVDGSINFHSDAPRELIRAVSHNLTGAVDLSKRTFLFKISIVTFSGFNNSLQKEHFNENYMESSMYPLATYSGKIIEDIDMSKDGNYDIRAKGKLMIHGVEHQRIIRCRVVCKNNLITVSSDFTVFLADYNIKIPRIVSDKLAEEVKVSVHASMTPLVKS